jgi:hypothetical protein
MSATTAKEVLETRKIRWSSPSQFNDPFDVCALTFLSEVDSWAVHRELNFLVLNILEGCAPIPENIGEHLKTLLMLVSLNASVRDQLISEMKNNPERFFREKGALSALREAFIKLLPQFRILCLSEINNSTLMWSHYADKHKGVVLELLAQRESDSPWLEAKPINYKSPSEVAVSAKDVAEYLLHETGLTSRMLFDKWCYTKTTDWQYEKEWRVVTFADQGDDGAYSDWGVNLLDFRAMYFGVSMDESMRCKLIELTQQRYPHIKLYDAKASGLSMSYSEI